MTRLYPHRVKRLSIVLLLIVAACTPGPSAPQTTPATTVCTTVFCLDAPDGWGDEVGETHIAFHHDLSPTTTFLTASVVDMEAIVVAAGGEWPAPTETVVESFWTLLEDVDEGKLTRIERMVGGGMRSWGSHSTGDMWFLLVPVDGTTGIGVEIRGPNNTWGSHADAVFPTVIATG